MKTLIAIPTYNEFGNINLLLDSIFKENINLDILFVDDNSQDETQKAIKDYQKNDPSSHLNEEYYSEFFIKKILNYVSSNI